MKKPKEKKVRLPMKPLKKLLLVLLCVAAFAGICYLLYYFLHYMRYDKYKSYLKGYEYEAGTEFEPVRESKSDVKGMELVTENELLKLYTNTKTAEIAVYDKRNQTTVYSNPVDGEKDTLANKTNLNYLKSQLIISYYNAEIKSGTWDSYSMAVERGQVKCEAVENGIRYIYDFGDYSTNKTGILPIYLTPEKFEELVLQMAETDASRMRRFYVESTDVPGMLEINGITKNNLKLVEKILAWLDAVGWTEEDYIETMELAGVSVEEPLSFTIPLEYRLEEDGVRVSIPVCGIEERGNGAIYRIQLLRYMGAAGTEEDGYLVVPNGSGSLIHFNNGKTTVPGYSQYVYDIDPLLASYTKIETTDPAKLPLFGICRKDSSVLATIEEGKSITALNAGVSGVYSSYNYAYPVFILRNADNLLNFGASALDVYVLEPELYDVNCTVKYTLLTKEQSGYSGIAEYYRNRLIAEGRLSDRTAKGDLPFYYDIIGAVKKTTHILGTQFLRPFAMTTFEEAETIAKELSEAGVTNQVMNFQGWFNGGFYHDAADRIKVVKKLGGKKGLESLSAYLRELGGRFYADAAFQKVTYADDGFNYNAEGSRYYGAGYVVSFGQWNPTSLSATSMLGYMETAWNHVSPKFLPRYVGKFAKKVMKYDFAGISLRDLGNTLQSDKKRTEIINREEALSVVLGQFDTLLETEKKLMVDNGFDYTFPYASDIINVTAGQNEFFIVDEDIPLYEMIVHGYIDYASPLLNMEYTGDTASVILKLVEYGMAPHYVFTWEESNEMKNTGLSRYYATTYSTWKQEALTTYETVNSALKHVAGAVMQKHEILPGNVRKVTYDNGVVIYVNYNAEAVTVDGITVPAQNFEMGGRSR